MLPEAHSTKQIEDLRGLGARHRRPDARAGHAERHGGAGDATGPDRARAQGAVPGARDPRHRRPGPALLRRQGAREDHRWSARDGSGRRASAARAQARAGQPRAARVRRDASRARPDGPPLRRPQARALHLLADRARARAARRRDRARAARARRRPRDRLARPASRDPRPRGGRGAHPSRQRAPRQRVAPHRVRVGRARPPLLPRLAADGRDHDQQLHGLPRRRARGALRPLDRRRGVGARLLPAREPGREARPVRVADRLRRMAPDARRRRARGLPHRRLQRRDGRAHRRAPQPARPRDLRRQPRGHRRRAARPAAADDPRLDRAQLRVLRIRDGLRPAQRSATGPSCATSSATARTRRSASSASAGRASAAICCGG